MIKVLQKGKVSKTLTFVVTEAEKFILKATELKKKHRRFSEIHTTGLGIGKPGPEQLEVKMPC